MCTRFHAFLSPCISFKEEEDEEEKEGEQEKEK